MKIKLWRIISFITMNVALKQGNWKSLRKLQRRIGMRFWHSVHVNFPFYSEIRVDFNDGKRWKGKMCGAFPKSEQENEKTQARKGRMPGFERKIVVSKGTLRCRGKMKGLFVSTCKLLFARETARYGIVRTSRGKHRENFPAFFLNYASKS